MPLWTPSEDRIAGTRMHEFVRSVAVDHPEVVDSVDLHDWSVSAPGEFWSRMWSYGGVVGDQGATVFDPADGSVRYGRFFPESSVNVAENLLADRSGAGDEAIVAITEAGDLVVVRARRVQAELDLIESGEYHRLLSVLNSHHEYVREIFDFMPRQSDEDWSNVQRRLSVVPLALDRLRASFLYAADKGQVAARRQALACAAQRQGGRT